MTQLPLDMPRNRRRWARTIERLEAEALAMGEAYTGPRWARATGQVVGRPAVFCPVCLEPLVGFKGHFVPDAGYQCLQR